MKGSDSSRKPRKTLKAVPDNVYTNMLRLVFKEGGKVPDYLSGLYKSRAVANKAIEHYNEGYDRSKIQPRAPTVKSDDEIGTLIDQALEASGGSIGVPNPPITNKPDKTTKKRGDTDNAEERREG